VFNHKNKYQVEIKTDISDNLRLHFPLFSLLHVAYLQDICQVPASDFCSFLQTLWSIEVFSAKYDNVELSADKAKREWKEQTSAPELRMNKIYQIENVKKNSQIVAYRITWYLLYELNRWHLSTVKDSVTLDKNSERFGLGCTVYSQLQS
jgi:hypothetical protein